jgi:uncharacterized membrane protein
LIKLANKNKFVIRFRYSPGHFVLANVPIADLYTSGSISKELESDILSQISLAEEPTDNVNFYSGFKQLSEIAIKALSPGINDPGTAAESLQMSFALLAYRIKNFPDNNIRDNDGVVRVITREMTFDEIFQRYIIPVWDYGKDDRNIHIQMSDLLIQLQYLGKSVATQKLLIEIQKKPFRNAE